ncbi:MAG: formate dehydrogenase accessory sulfurtransferase FdhD [Stellaceae bacterium]
MSLLAAERPHPVYQDAQRRVWRDRLGADMPPSRRVPEETPVAFAYQGASYAVMMATPADLADFALGFSLNEEIVGSPEEIEAVDTIATSDGILLRIALADRRADAFWERRRYLAGPSGCGLCGIESLSQAARRPRRVSGDIRVSGDAIHRAMTKLPERQTMNRLTGALHAAAFWTPDNGIVAVREDVGRHNALDKLTGAVASAALPAAAGAVLLTSRVSVEMVQKAASLGAPILVAVSAPTALALRAAKAAGITLIAVARHDGFETFTHPHRIA